LIDVIVEMMTALWMILGIFLEFFYLWKQKDSAFV